MTREWDPERCMCSFAPRCGGYGTIPCDGCGGETCVCAECHGHGEIDCDGCDDCEHDADATGCDPVEDER